MYQALYRKWRPRTFSEMAGQEAVIRTLRHQVASGRIAHAYLFCGSRGTGKTSAAKIMARAINCENPQDGDPCLACPACKALMEDASLDVFEMDAASNSRVEEIRDLLEKVDYPPQFSKYKVYIIDEVHMLSTAAFNALLKILEEPPEHLVFILATTELNKVPATILSRCQRHSFKRLDAQLIADHLEHVAQCENLRLERSAAELIAGLAEGGMRDALSLLDQCSGESDIDTDAVYSAMGLTGNRRTAQLLDYAVKKNTDEALKLFDSLWRDGKDPATLLYELNTLLRDCLMLSVAPKAGADLISGRFSRDILGVFCKKLTKAELINRINIVSDSLLKIRDSKSAKLTAELCIISLCEPRLTEGVDELRARISRIEEDLKHAPARTAVPAAEDDDDEEEFHSTLDEPPFDLDEPPAPQPRYEDDPADELDPADFAEYQPEDDLLDKKSPVELNPDAPASAADAPQDNESLWAAIVENAEESLPRGVIPILTNPVQTRCTVSYDTLALEVVPGFFYNAVNNQAVLMRLREAANAVTGRSLKITISELREDNDKPKRDIEELRKFKETRFV